MEGPNFYELEPPAPAAAANGEMAIFVHTHTQALLTKKEYYFRSLVEHLSRIKQMFRARQLLRIFDTSFRIQVNCPEMPIIAKVDSFSDLLGSNKLLIVVKALFT